MKEATTRKSSSHSYLEFLSPQCSSLRIYTIWIEFEVLNSFEISLTIAHIEHTVCRTVSKNNLPLPKGCQFPLFISDGPKTFIFILLKS